MLILTEHEQRVQPADAALDAAEVRFSRKRGDDGLCVKLRREGENWHLETSYYVGAGWLLPSEVAVRVQPKLNDQQRSIDHMGMLFACLEHPDVAPFVGELYELDFEGPFIALPREEDSLTPLLVAHLLHLLREVVKQGLKKGYNPVAREMRGRVKGKIEIAKTLRQGVFRQRPLLVACSFEEFSYDIPENRVLKKALRFARHYLRTYTTYEKALEPLISYCEPAFTLVSDEEALTHHGELHSYNPLYRTYNEALRVAHLLLRRFGYSLLHIGTDAAALVHVPPHWIDMSCLFELYVLGMLRDRFGVSSVAYGSDQAAGLYGLPDFLLRGAKPWIVDAKYKRAYQYQSYVIEDVRQLSGYARDKGVLEKLGYVQPEEQDAAVVRCLIVYPQQFGMLEDGLVAEVGMFPTEDDMSKYAIPQFTRFYKLAVAIPEKKPASNA